MDEEEKKKIAIEKATEMGIIMRDKTLSVLDQLKADFKEKIDALLDSIPERIKQHIIEQGDT